MVELANAMVLLLLGGMLFFPIVVAPVVFTSLPELEAGQFLRSMFPRYYLFMIFFSALAFGLYQSAAGSEVTIAAAVCLSVALSTLWVRQSLVPRINDVRDAQLAGDVDTGAKFDRGHRLSVAINMLQLVGLIAILFV
tara:strand:+ start:174 stop:587 length:414 start_codon:yes stop_codon:yes gene_type:complete